MSEKFDAAIVGAGPAGLSAAYKLAEAGLKVIVIERGEFPGSKNVMGGVLYKKPTEAIIPEFFKEAPLERPIVEQRVYLLTDTAKVSFSFKDTRYLDDITGYTVFRAKFDRWFAKKVEEKGALIITETVVDDLIIEKGRVIGVRTGRADGEIFADVVILAEGAHCLLAQKHGYQNAIATKNLAVAVKEVIGLPPKVIEDRFNLNPGEGAAIELFGASTAGMVGVAFLYTNKNSVSIGVGALISEILKSRITPNDLIERFKAHPVIKPLIKDGEIKEYLAHLIPEGGYNAVPKLVGDGILIVGDAAMLVNAVHREGANLAMTSGSIAAQAVIRAKEKGDYSAKTLRYYEETLRDSFVMKDLKQYRNIKSFLEKNDGVLTEYPEIVSDAMFDFFMVNGVPKSEKLKGIRRSVFGRRSFWQMGKDAYSFWKEVIR